jgi:hypothetical protein
VLRGVPKAVFETELLPEIERKFLTGERDHVDSERGCPARTSQAPPIGSLDSSLYTPTE